MNAVAKGRTVEVVAEDGTVEALSVLFDAAAGGGAALAIPAPAKAALTANRLASFDAAQIIAILDGTTAPRRR